MGPGEWYSLGCALAWGTAVILFKKSGESLGPFELSLFKNLLVLPLFAITILVFSGPRLPEIPAGELPLILFSGLCGIAIGDTIYFHALNKIGASRMAAAQTLYSPFVILLSILFLGETLRAWQFVGVALVLFGIFLVTYVRSADEVEVRDIRIGVGFGGFAVFLMAIGVVIAKPMLERYDFLWVVTLRIVGGVLGMLLVVAWRRNGRELMAAYRAVRHWPQIIIGALIGTYLSTMLWLAGYKYTDASIAAVLNELAAIAILFLAVVFLKEKVSLRQQLGVVLAVGGVVLVVWR